jgi:serine/threonine-protein kinase HipA
MKNEIKIWVYADWEPFSDATLMGVLTVYRVRGKEVFAFEYHDSWLSYKNPILHLDPHLSYFKGQQYLPEGKSNFGIFLDSAPDRWGRLLMRRREALQARREQREEKTLYESDYLLGVLDLHRLGGIRFKLDPNGEFMSSPTKLATPPWTSLRELAFASLQIEQDEPEQEEAQAKWLEMLIAPGSSLGGARPKASVTDEKGNLWIAKFPSASDLSDNAAWEMVLRQLAFDCGINVPEARILPLSGPHHTYLSKRFDRSSRKKRIHFASAMTLLGYQDGTNYQEGISYLDMGSFIIQHGAAASADLLELWRRVVFNILVSNTDDHLRNHGFLLTEQGWRLSPAYDMNPNETGTGLTLNISSSSNELDLSLALETAKYYKLKIDEAHTIVHQMRKTIANWSKIASTLGISRMEIERKARAFKHVSA